jgi:hypothetical protein
MRFAVSLGPVSSTGEPALLRWTVLKRYSWYQFRLAVNARRRKARHYVTNMADVQE